jgi:hypothetical protein
MLEVLLAPPQERPRQPRGDGEQPRLVHAMHTPAKGAGARARLIRRPAVDNHQLDIRVRLPQHREDRGPTWYARITTVTLGGMAG